MPKIPTGQFSTQFFVPPGDYQGLKIASHLVQRGQDFRHRPHSKPAAQHEQHPQVIAQSVIFSHCARVGATGEFRRDGNAGHHHVLRLCPAGHQTGLRFLCRHAIQIHRWLHPERVRLEVRDHADCQWIESLPFQMGHDLDRQVMRANHGVRPERLQIFHELFVGLLGKPSPETGHLPQQLRVVRLLEHHAPQLRRVFHQFHVALDVNPALQARNKIEQIDLLHHIARAQGAPCLLQSGCRLQMPRPGRDRRDQDAHVGMMAGYSGSDQKQIPEVFWRQPRWLMVTCAGK